MKARLPYNPSKKEQEIMKVEIKKQVLKTNEEYSADVDALFLWVLHEKYGWGKKRLREVFDSISELWQYLRDFYNMPTTDDNIWICRRKLLDIGVDVLEWNKNPNVIIGGDKNDRN